MKLICDSLELSFILYICFRVWPNADSNFGNDRFHITSNKSGNLKGQQYIDLPKLMLLLYPIADQSARIFFRNIFVFRQVDAFCFYCNERTSFSRLKKRKKEREVYEQFFVPCTGITASFD